jgi:uncharacterized protein YegJ (DUF2314 family)
VKAPFSDGESADRREEMWIAEINFDGESITGELLNAPNWLKTVHAGDTARRQLDEITDWMYVINGEVYGAYTVNLMRSRMSRQERREHDEAWGLNFGDPNTIRVVPAQKKSGGLLRSLFGKREAADSDEHPMSEAMAPSLREQLKQNPAMVREKDERGWTFLHQLALAGSTANVGILLEHGADVKAVTDHGMTPLALASSLGWDKVMALLRSKGAR